MIMSRIKLDGLVDSAGVVPAPGSNVFIYSYCLLRTSRRTVWRLLLDFLNGLIDALQRRLTPEHFQCFKQRRGCLASADSDADRQEHLSRLDLQVFRFTPKRTL